LAHKNGQDKRGSRNCGPDDVDGCGAGSCQVGDLVSHFSFIENAPFVPQVGTPAQPTTFVYSLTNSSDAALPIPWRSDGKKNRAGASLF